MSTWTKLVKAVVRDIPRHAESLRAQVRTLAAAAEPLRAKLEQMALAGPPATRVTAYRALLGLEAAIDMQSAIATGERLLPAVATSFRARRALAGWHRRTWAIERPAELLADANTRRGQLGAKVARELACLRQGLPLSAKRSAVWTSAPKRVAYVVASSLPYHPAGYGMRTRGLVGALARAGWDMHVVARPGYPNDRWDYPHWRLAPERLTVEGVPHWFSPHRDKLGYARDPAGYHARASDALYKCCLELRPQLIHAASNYNCGLIAAEVSRRLGVPFIYEVRGLWHVTKAAAEPGYADSDHFRLIMALELQAARAADHVFAITSGVAQELIDGGVPRDHISLLPNTYEAGADDRVAPPADRPLRTQFAPAGETLLGYVGSLNAYEGLDDAIAAAATVARRGHNLALVIVGDGPARRELEAAAAREADALRVHFVGRVSPDAVRGYIELLDLFLLPRQPVRVCELVAPLKPYEAMAMGKAILASDVAPLLDVIDHGNTGWLFRKGDSQDLAVQLEQLVVDPALRARLGTAGRDWLARQNGWTGAAEQIAKIYGRLLADR